MRSFLEFFVADRTKRFAAGLRRCERRYRSTRVPIPGGIRRQFYCSDRNVRTQLCFGRITFWTVPAEGYVFSEAIRAFTEAQAIENKSPRSSVLYFLR